MAPSYTLIITLKDSSSGLIIPSASISDQIGRNVTTNSAGIAYLSEQAGTAGGVIYATGYISRAWSIVIDNDTSITYTMSPSSSSSTTRLNALYPHETTIVAMDMYGNRLSGINVTTVVKSTSLQGNWWGSLFGISSDIAPNYTISVMDGVTDTSGKVAFPMIASATYNVTFWSSYYFTGGYHEVDVTPDQTVVNLYLPTKQSAAPALKAGSINSTLYNNATLDPTNYLTLEYNDTSLGTTSVTFFVNYPNYTSVYATTLPGTPTTNQSFRIAYAVQDVKGAAYVWGYYSNTTFGNSSKSTGITFNGPSGTLVDVFTYHSGWD